MLEREKTSVENQVFEMGPKNRAMSVDRRDDYSRGHCLGKECHPNDGMPWCPPKPFEDGAPKPAARRATLRHERQEADQCLEWVPAASSCAPKNVDACHARRNVCKREVLDSAQTLEFAPGVQMKNLPNVGKGYHGRVNVMQRESGQESGDNPVAAGYSGGVPIYNRKTMLPPYVPRVSAAH